jgi:hypothetical protein
MTITPGWRSRVTWANVSMAAILATGGMEGKFAMLSSPTECHICDKVDPKNTDVQGFVRGPRPGFGIRCAD